jgi:hypothetical protein
MTRKHFIEIARQINAQRGYLPGLTICPDYGASEILDKLSEVLADSFEGFNQHFNRARFLDACGVNESPVGWQPGEARRAARMAYERAEEALDTQAIARYNARKVSK